MKTKINTLLKISTRHRFWTASIWQSFYWVIFGIASVHPLLNAHILRKLLNSWQSLTGCQEGKRLIFSPSYLKRSTFILFIHAAIFMTLYHVADALLHHGIQPWEITITKTHPTPLEISASGKACQVSTYIHIYINYIIYFHDESHEENGIRLQK